MNQQQALSRILEFAERHFAGDRNSMTAARAAFVILWLQDINWHNEARALAERTLTTPCLKGAFERLEYDVMRTGEFQDTVALFTSIFGWTIKPKDWRATGGSKLVEELWELINTIPTKELRDDVSTSMQIPD